MAHRHAHNPAGSAGRTVLEVLEDFPSARVPLQWLLQIVPRLQPRYFSIASSLAAHPGQVHILAALVDYQTPHRRRKRGVCSAWLAGLQPGAPDARVSGSFSKVVRPCTFLSPAWSFEPALLATPDKAPAQDTDLVAACQ